MAFLGCLLVAGFLHEPVPRVHDEFSYMLMADSFAHGRAANPTPVLPEFFDTFHVLMRPVYASKYFPVQGAFLALGEKLTGHPAVGVWLSSALACAAAYWMLRAWIGPAWALLGGFLMVVQYGIFSYWSQSYWGGMVAALGGALAFGAARRLWDEFSWRSSIWLALGIVILVNSRPFEGFLALLPVTGVFLLRLWREKQWKRAGFLSRFVLPAGVVLAVGASITCAYNRAITGSPWKPPYVLHEEQYQESPQFVFLPLRPKITYSSPWVQNYYEVSEARLYLAKRTPKYMMAAVSRTLKRWWSFFCGILLTPALVFPALLRKGKIRYLQAALLVCFTGLALTPGVLSFPMRDVVDLLAVAQLIVCWLAFDTFWPRLAIATTTLLLIEGFATKLFHPHYFAPAASLVLYLEVEGLRRIWHWNPRSDREERNLSRSERRRLEREPERSHWLVPRLRALVYYLPIICVISLVLRVEARINGWKEDFGSPEGRALLLKDWSLTRAEIDRWLEQQPGPQLVFVRYSARHSVLNEWVYNHADIMGSQVVWARDLGAEHNSLLLQAMPDRTVWSLEADLKNPQLVPYAQAPISVPAPENHATPSEDRSDQ
jgi:hypothetical protein